MQDRAPLREYFSSEAHRAEQKKQYAQQIAELRALESTLVDGFNKLFKFLDGKVTKAEIVNQLEGFATTEDLEKLITTVERLDQTTLSTKLDINPVLDALNDVREQIKNIPEVTFEQRDSIKVENLDEINLDTSSLEKAIKALKLDVKVEPKVNVEKPDFRPLQDIMLDLLQAFKSQKDIEFPDEIKISNLNDIKATDTSKIESKLDTSNKYLKEISEKRFGGSSGGGGESTLAFPLYADITTTISADGNTIIKTDGVKTLTTTITATADGETITEVWS